MRHRVRSRHAVGLAALTLALLIAIPAPRAHASKLVVATNGVDGVDCGPSASPCRTIGRAIANAQPGDTVEVGPGRYGDLNADGDFADPGDEAAQVDVGCDCVIHVDRALVIVSRDGAGATLIAAAAPADLVHIDAAGTTFGKPKHGFTLRGSGGSGLDSNADGLIVGGNIAVDNTETGIGVFGERSTVIENRAVHNGFSGFNVQFSNGVIRGNVAVGNGGNGFSPDGHNLIVGNAAIANGGDGFQTNGGDSLLKGNVALGNGGFGFSLSNQDLLTGSIASGNQRGVRIGDGTVVTKSVIVGNQGIGVVDSNGIGGTVTKNSIFGNHFATDAFIVGSNCGVLLRPGVHTPPLLSQNFWGATAGPGGDPADAICTVAPLGAPLVIDPVATKEIKVKAKAAR